MEAFYALLEEKMQILKAVEDELFTLLLDEVSEDELTAETNAWDEYSMRFKKLQVRCNKETLKHSEGISQSMGNAYEINQSISNSRNLRLPKIELVKFGGDVPEWLPFWSQFKKIDEAADLAPEDKFQYLLLATTLNTRARDLVESFPPTGENYAKVISSLKSRFGREDLLVEVYVRELLRLVLNNTASKQFKCCISTLYDKIETQLRALEILGINTGTCSAMLYPLVESCLPEDLLHVWQRSTEFSDKPDATLKNRLDRLMLFLKSEVVGAERITLAVEGFGIGARDNMTRRNNSKNGEQSRQTATGLINNNITTKCVFCDGNHTTERCFKEQKLSFKEKMNELSKKRACFRCSKLGHVSRKCRGQLRCLLCGGQHIALLCPDLKMSESSRKSEAEKPDTSHNSVITEAGLTNHTDTRVFLQTLIVKMRSEGGEVRANIDTGSQRSYILKHVAQELKYRSKRTETMVHALFGGTQTSVQKHACYDVRLMSLDGNYACKFKALDQTVICDNIPSIFSGIWTKELRDDDIQLTDTKGHEPVALLIGADIAGKIITGKKQVLSCGLIAMETLLDWVMMGKIPCNESSQSTTMLVTNLLNRESSVAALWQLDVLGIKDPAGMKSKIENESTIKDLFSQTIVVDKEGRYEVKMPWIEGHPPLPSNYSLCKKRLEAMEKRLVANGHWQQYQQIFSEWLEKGIIEEVPQTEMSNSAHYLPHRPVLKENSTTKMRKE